MEQKYKTKIITRVNDKVPEVIYKVGIGQLIGSENIGCNYNDVH